MSKNEEMTNHNLCAVCGDIALGRNFGGISCESCKAFFRRNAFKTIKKKMKCKTKGKCIINIENRKSCTKCRLNKCLSIGMIKELLMKNTGKICSETSIKNIENIQTDSICASIDSKSNSSNNSRLFDPEFDALFENCCLSEQQINEEIMKIEESLNKSIKSIDWKADHSVVPIVRPIATFNKNLNDMEVHRIKELFCATTCFRCDVNPKTQKKIIYSTVEEYYLNDYIVDKFELATRIYIQFCKQLDPCKEICPGDQLALVKQGYFETVTWQNIPHFNFAERYWEMRFSKCSIRFYLDVLKAENSSIYEFAIKLFEKLCNNWISDSTIRNLLSAMAFFNPNKPGIKHKSMVKLKQQMYLYLLQRYLIMKYGSESESMEMCSNIMNCVRDLHLLSENQKVIEKNYQHLVTPLLKEFID